jgi:hypothetical protein
MWRRWTSGGGALLADRARDVRYPPPPAAVVEFVEVEVTVERHRLIMDRVDDHRSRSELAATTHTIHEQVAAERPALVSPVWCKPREPHHLR